MERLPDHARAGGEEEDGAEEGEEEEARRLGARGSREHRAPQEAPQAQATPATTHVHGHDHLSTSSRLFEYQQRQWPDGRGSPTASSAARSSGVRAYEPGKPVEEVQREHGHEHVVKLASNEGPFPPFPAALEAIDRAAARAEPLPGRRGLPAAHRARRAPRRPLRGGGGRRRRGRADRLRLAGDARSRRRDRLRLAFVRELRDRRAEARSRAEDGSAPSTTATTSRRSSTRSVRRRSSSFSATPTTRPAR